MPLHYFWNCLVDCNFEILKTPYSFILWFSKYSICKDYEVLINVDDCQMVLLSIMKYLKKNEIFKKKQKLMSL